MTIIELIIIALAIGIESMILTYNNTRPDSIRLTQGLLASALLALVYALLAAGGQAIGHLLRFGDAHNIATDTYERINCMVYIGLIVLLVMKKLLAMRRAKKNKTEAIFDLQSITNVIALAIASGVDVLIIGMGIGFLPTTHSYSTTALPIILSTLLLSYLGVMFGRQKVVLRPQRWQYIAIVILLTTAIYHGVDM